MTTSPAVLLSTDVAGGTFLLREATGADLPDILRLLADDRLGAGREDQADLGRYLAAFAAIDADPAHQLVVGRFLGPDGSDTMAATCQLSMLPGLSRQGSWRAQIEAVRVAAELRSHGLGGIMIRWAIAESRRRGCAMVQLTTDKSRTEAQRFYSRLGFTGSHLGMKLVL